LSVSVHILNRVEQLHTIRRRPLKCFTAADQSHDAGALVDHGRPNCIGQIAGAMAVAAGQNLADRFRAKEGGVWELRLQKPAANPGKGLLTVSVRDRQGNETKVERTFSVQATTTRRE
jgi:hypothetical protein